MMAQKWVSVVTCRRLTNAHLYATCQSLHPKGKYNPIRGSFRAILDIIRGEFDEEYLAIVRNV
jgi:hypothetical protein